jgi:hypothetical protein
MTKNINYGTGNPITPTTTFNGRYDVSRGGSLEVTAGPNRFGGTLRFLSGGEGKNYNDGFYQFIFKYSPTSIFKAYGTTRCRKAGIDCTSDPSGPFGHSLIGDITTTGMVTRYLLNQQFSTGTGMRLINSTAKAKGTTLATENGTVPTVNGQGTPISSLPASYRVARNYYIQQIHPWTTGNAQVYNYFETPVQVNPRYAGYDTTLGDITLNVTRIYTGANFNTTANEVTYSTTTLIQVLTGVKRVVSMVRPRIVNNYERPVDENDPIFTNFSSARVWTMKVFFVPEPAGLAMMGAGIAALLGLSLMRRH